MTAIREFVTTFFHHLFLGRKSRYTYMYIATFPALFMGKILDVPPFYSAIAGWSIVLLANPGRLLQRLIRDDKRNGENS